MTNGPTTKLRWLGSVRGPLFLPELRHIPPPNTPLMITSQHPPRIVIQTLKRSWNGRAFQRALDHHLRQLPQRPALTGQPQPARTSPLGQLPQRLLIGRRQLHGLLAIIGRHVSHWCLLHLGGYTIEISVPPCLLG